MGSLMRATESQTPLMTVYTTVYNSKDTIKKSLESIIKALKGFDWEIVVVDNFSSDGTYEILLEYSNKYPVRTHQYKCSRGLGRNIASRLSRGKYLIYADLDCVYDSRLLKRLISGYLHSRYRDTKCIGIGGWMLICPKYILESHNFRDLNRAEDTDLATRLHKNNLIITLPLFKHSLKEEIRDASDSRGGSQYLLRPFARLFFPKTYISEMRYARKSIVGYIKREMRNQLDHVIGCAITLPKFVREELYVWHANYLTILYRTLLILFPLILLKLLGRRVFEGDSLLSNHLYVYYKALKDIENPILIGFSKNDFTAPNFDRAVRYIARFHPDIIDAIKRGIPPLC